MCGILTGRFSAFSFGFVILHLPSFPLTVYSKSEFACDISDYSYMASCRLLVSFGTNSYLFVYFFFFNVFSWVGLVHAGVSGCVALMGLGRRDARG